MITHCRISRTFFHILAKMIMDRTDAEMHQDAILRGEGGILRLFAFPLRTLIPRYMVSAFLPRSIITPIYFHQLRIPSNLGFSSVCVTISYCLRSFFCSLILYIQYSSLLYFNIFSHLKDLAFFHVLYFAIFSYMLWLETFSILYFQFLWCMFNASLNIKIFNFLAIFGSVLSIFWI